MKQTAVEWLIEELFKTIDYIQIDPKLIEQAKSMEIQQIKNAFQDGAHVGYNQDATSEEQYYNETYVKGDKRE